VAAMSHSQALSRLTAGAFEIEGDVIQALYVVRNSDKLRHLAAAPPPHESGRG